MNKVEQIIERFGGMAAMGRKLGHENVTTIQHWKKTGRVPHWRVLEIELAAELHNIDLPRQLLRDAAQKQSAPNEVA